MWRCTKVKEINPNNPLEPNWFLPSCRGKVRMGVEQRECGVSTPSLALPLQWGGDISANGLFRIMAIESLM